MLCGSLTRLYELLFDEITARVIRCAAPIRTPTMMKTMAAAD
jgi:hypothetical protein